MPTYSYRCEKCETKYEVFHKSKEIKEDVICPSCGSQEARKLMTAEGISGFSNASSYNLPVQPSCANGSCQSGLCNLN